MHPRPELLEQFACQTLSPEEIPAIEDHLLVCDSCQVALLALNGALQEGERRRYVRVSVDSTAHVKILDPITSIGPACSAKVLNICWDGMQLEMDRFVCAGSSVQIRLKDRIVLGKVRYCEPNGDKFRTGIHLQETLHRR